MKLHELKPAKGAVRSTKRLGRGMRLDRVKLQDVDRKVSGLVQVEELELVSKVDRCLYQEDFLRGFTNIFAKEYTEVNVKDLNRFENGTEITAELLKSTKVISKIAKDGIKILGEGELEKALTVKAAKFTASAQEKIEKAGGKAELV